MLREHELKAAELLKLVYASLLIACVAVGQQGPGSGAQRQAALSFEQQGKDVEAEGAWKTIAAKEPRNAEAYAHLGLLEARQQRYKEAIVDYRKALALNPQMPNLRMNLGLSLFKSGELKEAIETFKPLLAGSPQDSPQAIRLQTILGLAEYGVGNYGAAVPFLRAAVGADSQNLQMRLMLAHSCLWSKQPQCVLDEYREIITINPNAAEAYMLAGEAYDELKDDTNSLAQFEAAIKADPSTPNVHFGYGYILWRLKRFDEAEEAFRGELANDPEHVLSLAYLGDAEVHLQHNEQAKPLLEHAIRLDPSIALAHLDLGVVLESEGQKEDAVREYKTAEKLNTNDENVHWRLGRLYQSMGRREEAKAELEKTRNLQKIDDEPLIYKIDKKASGSDGQTQSSGTAPK